MKFKAVFLPALKSSGRLRHRRIGEASTKLAEGTYTPLTAVGDGFYVLASSVISPVVGPPNTFKFCVSTRYRWTQNLGCVTFVAHSTRLPIPCFRLGWQKADYLIWIPAAAPACWTSSAGYSVLRRNEEHW